MTVRVIYTETQSRAMYFLVKNDLYNKITEIDLNTITGGDDSILDSAELNAMAEIDTYLRGLYDMRKSWVRRGTMRYAGLIQHCVIVLLYHVHTRMAPNNVPQSRIYDYDNTIKFLKAVGEGTYTLDLPLLVNSTDPLENPLTQSRMIFISLQNESFRY